MASEGGTKRRKGEKRPLGRQKKRKRIKRTNNQSISLPPCGIWRSSQSTPAAPAAQPHSHIHPSNNIQPGQNTGPTNQATASLLAQNPTDNRCEQLLTKEQVRLRLGLPNKRAVDELIRRRQIPVVSFSTKTARFIWPDVLAALGRLTIREASGNDAPPPRDS